MRPFNDLSEGKEWFISWLRKHQFKDIIDTDSISRYYHWDLEATYKDERYCFELKNRTFPSSQFSDTAINKYKYEYLRDCGHRGVLVTFWNDCFCLIDVQRLPPDGEIIRECPRQTRFQDHRLYDNHMVKWDIQNLKLLQYD